MSAPDRRAMLDRADRTPSRGSNARFSVWRAPASTHSARGAKSAPVEGEHELFGFLTTEELVEKAAMIGIGAAFGHGAEATPRPCQAQSGRRSARSRAAL
jgi:hypothetical protein